MVAIRNKSTSSIIKTPVKNKTNHPTVKLSQKIKECVFMGFTTLFIGAFSVIASPFLLVGGLSFLTTKGISKKVKKEGKAFKQINSINLALKSAFHESRSFCKAALFYFRNEEARDPKEGEIQNNDKNPILLIHGFLHTSGAFTDLRKKLEKEGRTVFTINLGNTCKRIKNHDAAMKKKVAKILELTGKEKVDLIGHSRGGLVATRFATEEEGKEKIGKIITLGTPFQGTRLAKVTFGAAKDMYPKAPFLTDLKTKIETSNLDLHTIASTHDEVLLSSKNAKVKGEKSANNIQNTGHIGLLYRKNVLDKVVELLEENS